MRYLLELKENEHVIEHYFCKHKQSLKTRSGKTYYALKLQDKTGVVDAKVWELHGDIGNFEEGEIIKIDGIVQNYQNELQIKVNKIRKSRDGEFKHSDYVPTTEKNIDEMFERLVSLIKSVENNHVKTLLENIILKNSHHSDSIKTHSAAKSMHHSYMGGLLEHIVSVTEICEFMSRRYKYINRDILIAGALLHDIGKIYELSPLPKNEYTDDGQMLGHIILGVEMISAEVAKIPDFPHELASLIKHMIVSHHGEYEFGSPKLPSIPEAILLHYADNIDAKLKIFEEAFDKDTSPGPWVAGYQKSLNRYMRKSDFS